MRRNGFGAGSFLLGILVGIVLLILIAFAVSSNSTVQFNSPNGSAQPTATPQGKIPATGVTVTFNARAEWDHFIAEIAALPQAIVNWVRSLDNSNSGVNPPIIVATPTP